MVKRVIIVLFTVILTLVSITGCSNKDKLKSSSEASSTETSDIDITDSSDVLSEEETSSSVSETTSTSASSNKKTTSVVIQTPPKKTSFSSSKLTESQIESALDKLDAKNKTIRIMSHYPSDNDGSMINAQRFKKYCNGNVQYVTMPADWHDIGNRLITLIMANDSPDLYAIRPQDYPAMIVQGLWQELEKYINFSLPEWSARRDYLDSIAWDGKHYVAGGTFINGAFIWYNIDMMEEFGITKHPGMLHKEGKWDWNAMLDIAKKCTNEELGTFGLAEDVNFEFEFMAAYKQDLIKIDNKGNIEQNIDNPKLNEALTYYSELYTKHKVMSEPKTTAYNLFKAGKLAMMNAGYYQAAKGGYFHKERNNKANISFIYFPKKPGEAKYTYAASINGFAIPKGAKNPNEAAMYITMDEVLVSSNEEFEKEAARCLWTEEEKQIIKDVNKHCEMFTLYLFGFEKAYMYFSNDGMVDIVYNKKSWSTIKDQVKPKVIEAINDFKNLQKANAK